MSASSGISASADLTSTLADAIQSQTVRFIKVSIRNESLEHDLSISRSGSFQDDLQVLQQEDILPSNNPAYILAKLDPPSPDWITIFYVPDTAKVRDKMLYASTRGSLLKSLGSSLFVDSIYANAKTDLTADAYSAHLIHVSAPNPLSSREQEIANLRAAESETVYEGSRARSSHVGTGVGLVWSLEAETAMLDLIKGSVDAALVLGIDPQSESLIVHSANPTTVHNLSSSIPRQEPSYTFFLWSHSYKSPATRELVFIYSCPLPSPIKHRMVYSSGSSSVVQTAKSLVSPEEHVDISFASRKIETSDPEEVNEAFLKGELNYSDTTIASPSDGSGTKKPFARPKGPPRRR